MEGKLREAFRDMLSEMQADLDELHKTMLTQMQAGLDALRGKWNPDAPGV